ncbi:MAG: 4-hydroxy-tetrahydrodipicolinate synthase [Armatimonadetes bacterium]|nr:4-hydroxy-tetrahydrodipicolinate synthase [Armatimonadota bacterium]
MELGRLLTAMATPFDADLKVDYAAVERLAQHLLDTGSQGIVVSGTTGESPTLTKEEKLELFRVVKRTAAGRAAVVAGTGTYSTAESIELTRAAEKTGVDAVMLVAPYYNKPQQEGLYQHFRTVAESTALPVILYNVPSRTVTDIQPQTVIRLAEVPNIIAIKEATKNMEVAAEIRAGTPPSFRIYSGDDSVTLPLMAVGGHGIISVAGHLCGRSIREMTERFASGDTAGALDAHLKLFPLFRAIFVTTSPVPLKHALNRIGVPVGGVRPPLVAANEKEMAVVDAAMRGLGLI